jgi:UDP-N-acetylglucosamine:LPS N-acetylglucosamine transferase
LMISRSAPRRPKVLAISSGGGHWVQLLRLRPAFDGCDVTFATVKPTYRVDVANARFRVIADSNRWSKSKLARTAATVLWVLLTERPDVVISTGAAPGFFAVCFGKALGARTIWVDSIANVEELSMSGRKAARWADLWLTQWPHLVRPDGPLFRGSVL